MASEGLPSTVAREPAVSASGAVVFWLTWALVLFALWLALVGKVVTAELLAGAASAAAAATAVTAVRAQGLARFNPRGRWLLAGWRLPLSVTADSLRLAVALARRGRLPGQLRELAVVPAEDERESARRALAIAGRSAAPNRYALGFDPSGERLLVHELVADEPIDSPEPASP
jgi:hypothetical protein